MCFEAKVVVTTDNANDVPEKTLLAFHDAESVEFAGKAVANLAADPEVMRKTGRIQLTADLAREYGFTDVDGRVHGEMRSVKSILARAGWTTLAGFVPGFVRVPHSLVHYMSYKF